MFVGRLAETRRPANERRPEPTVGARGGKTHGSAIWTDEYLARGPVPCARSDRPPHADKGKRVPGDSAVLA